MQPAVGVLFMTRSELIQLWALAGKRKALLKRLEAELEEADEIVSFFSPLSTVHGVEQYEWCRLYPSYRSRKWR